jgi:hypothetical protein
MMSQVVVSPLTIQRGKMMATDVVTLQLPVNLYDKLQELAAAEQVEPIEVITHLIALAYQLVFAFLTSILEQLE